MSLVNAIGVISGILGIISFDPKNFAHEHPVSGSIIKVAVALDGPSGPTNAGGDLPDVRIWNDVGDFVGINSKPGRVKSGNLGEIQVRHDTQGVYSLFSANNDAICVAWVTMTWTDDRGGNKYAVSGDYGEVCGGTWFESHMYPNGDEEYQPKCFWIDGDGNQPTTGFQVRWPAFSKDALDKNNTDAKTMCNGIDFGLRDEHDPNVIHHYTKKRSTPVRAYQASVPRPEWAATDLVISDSKHHSAKKLCMSDTSMGPDFVHIDEGLFCDMGTKVLYPFCGEDGGTQCFDMKTHTISTGPKMNIVDATSVVSDDAEEPGRYSRVHDWRQ
ncbi:hypothetical protein MaudCBS49596_007783 [Microsporum audouinii]